MSDETITLRHERSEREEYKRFMTYLNTPNQPRIRHNRRIDSRTDSGANTPGTSSSHLIMNFYHTATTVYYSILFPSRYLLDSSFSTYRAQQSNNRSIKLFLWGKKFSLLDPMSPHASSDFGGDVTSPITSPPATPSQVQDIELSGLDSHRSSALQNSLRRRTMPALRLGKDDATAAFTEDYNEVSTSGNDSSY